MNANNKKSGLGRGLEAFLGDEEFNLDDAKDVESFVHNTVFKDEKPSEVSLEDIKPCTFQPRTEFNAESLQVLADSIKEKGVLQPLLLRRKYDYYEIVAGERRWRAAQMAGLQTVPAIIKDLSDQETLELALIENLQRENLSAIEEAEGFNRLVNEYEYTQENLSKIIGKSRSYIANTLRLLSLPEEIKSLVRKNKLSAGHARCLVGCPLANEVAEKIITKELSVRETEKLVASLKNGSPKKQPKITDFDLQRLVTDLERKLNLKVKINASKNGKGSVTLKYNNPAELSAILDILEQR